MVTLPNIYSSKNLKFLVLVPLVLMVIGIILSTQIVLDTSLRGGISITLQTNSTISSQQLASQLVSTLHVVNPSIEQSRGGVTLTLDTNSSIAGAQNYLIAFYAAKADYSAFLSNATIASVGLRTQPDNQTLLAELHSANLGINQSLAKMNATLASQLTQLKPFIGGIAYNGKDPSNMQAVAQDSYNNASNVYKNQLISGLRSIIPFSSYSYQQVTPTLGSFFLQQLESIIITAFILIAIIAFIIFRSPVPALTVVFGAGNDIIIALGAMGLFKIPLGIASIAGLLMLIGYSMDTDVLTAIRILKRHEGTPESRAYSSMKTGLTMTTTAIVSFAVLFIVSLIAYIPTYYEISAVVLFGFIGDIFTTWFGNAALILMYKKRKDRV